MLICTLKTKKLMLRGDGVFWGLAPCSLVYTDRISLELTASIIRVMEAVSNTYQTTWRHILEDFILVAVRTSDLTYVKWFPCHHG
jgi:sulfite exporter TauE/SafE